MLRGEGGSRSGATDVALVTAALVTLSPALDTYAPFGATPFRPLRRCKSVMSPGMTFPYVIICHTTGL